MKRFITIALMLAIAAPIAATEPFPLILRIEDGGSSTEIPGALTWQELDYWGQNLRVLFRGAFPDATPVTNYSFFMPYTPLVGADCDSTAERGKVQVDSGAGPTGAWFCYCEGISGWACTGGAGGAAVQLVDADGDTKVQVEKTPDDDIVRLTSAGTEGVHLDGTGARKLFIVNPNANSYEMSVLSDNGLETIRSNPQGSTPGVTYKGLQNFKSATVLSASITAAVTTDVSQTISQIAGQTANLLEVYDSSPALVLGIDPDGDLVGTWDFDAASATVVWDHASTHSKAGVDEITAENLDTNCADNEIMKAAAGAWTCAADAGAGAGSPVALDLGDDASSESVDLAKIATSGDTNSIFTEPAADKLLINLANDWPKSDAADALAANGANCSAGFGAGGVDASGAAEDCVDFITAAENAATASALAANGANCAAGTAPLGVDASGAAESCYDTVEIAPGAEQAIIPTADVTGLVVQEKAGGGTADIFSVKNQDSSVALAVDAVASIALWATSGVLVSTEWATDKVFYAQTQDFTGSTELGVNADALTANGSNCTAGWGAGGVSAAGAAEDCVDFVTATENIATATDLAADGANCSAGEAPLGVNARGAVQGCWDVEEEAHAAEHAENAADELLAENLGTACANGYVVESDGAGGLRCAQDWLAFSWMDAPSGTDPIADSRTDTLTLLAAAPVTILGDATADSLTFSVTQNAGTDITADLEEEAHAAEHSAGETDPIPHLTAFNGVTITSAAVSVAESAGDVVFSVEQAGTGDIDVVFSDGIYTWDTTPAATITLTEGTKEVPVLNYVYLLQSTKTLTASTAGWPAEEHAPLTTVLIQTDVEVAAQGVLKIHAWTDHLIGADDQGHLAHLNEWIRNQSATYLSGGAQTYTITPNGLGLDTVKLTFAAGIGLQLHEHSFNAMVNPNEEYWINNAFNDATGLEPLDRVTDLSAVLEFDDGTGITNNTRFSLVFWLVLNESASEDKLFVNLPSCGYLNDADAITDPDGCSNYAVPNSYTGTALLLSRWTMKYTTVASGTWTSVDTQDLRGQISGTIAGSSGTGGVGTDDIGTIQLNDGASTPVAGDFIIVGADTLSVDYYSPMYGQMTMQDNSTAITVTVMDDWYQLTLVACGDSNGITCSTGTDDLTVTADGTYKIDYQATAFVDTTNSDLETGIFDEGVLIDESRRNQLGSITALRSWSGSAIQDMSTGDSITFRIRNRSNDNDLTIQSAIINVQRMK